MQPLASVKLATAATGFTSKGFLVWCLCLRANTRTGSDHWVLPLITGKRSGTTTTGLESVRIYF